MQEMQVQSLGQEDPLEKEMATHCSILAWEIPWTEEPGRLQSMGSQRVRHVFNKPSKVEIRLSGPDFLFRMMSVMRLTVMDASEQIPGLSVLHAL